MSKEFDFEEEFMKNLAKEELLKIFKEQDQKIAELEAKLAESEKFMQDNGFNNFDELDNYIQNIHFHYDEVKNKGTCGLCKHLENEEIGELKQQLAEKEKEIEQVKNLKAKDIGETLSVVVEKLTDVISQKLDTATILDILQKHTQDKISFAVEQLEKVKTLCKENFYWWENSEWEGDIYDKTDVSNAYFHIEAIIEEQIKQLKEKNNAV